MTPVATRDENQQMDGSTTTLWEAIGNQALLHLGQRCSWLSPTFGDKCKIGNILQKVLIILNGQHHSDPATVFISQKLRCH